MQKLIDEQLMWEKWQERNTIGDAFFKEQVRLYI